MTFWVDRHQHVHLATYLLMGKVVIQSYLGGELTRMYRSIDLDIEGGGAARKLIYKRAHSEVIIAESIPCRLSGLPS